MKRISRMRANAISSRNLPNCVAAQGIRKPITTNSGLSVSQCHQFHRLRQAVAIKSSPLGDGLFHHADWNADIPSGSLATHE